AALDGEHFDRAYASDLSRATETARAIVAKSGLELSVDPRLREFDFGQWEGLTWDQIVERWPEQQAIEFTDALHYHPAGGESFADVEQRVASFLFDLERKERGRALVATHAGVLHAVLSVLSPRLPVEQRSRDVIFAPASITRITMNGDGARLITLNDVRHSNT
ncbi:MAG: histidine phosphatase family protein, partial [Candidatus Eremiobacteraeota bacterium]|nr:histidine phosphatase family protein [Candidatus Eremiobacteraeota bacterium]